MNLKKLLSALMLVLSFSFSKGQDMLSSLGSLSEDQSNIAIATFKTTRLIDQHTIESLGPRTLDFRISHRFGPINSEAYNAWGLDGPANIMLSLEYSPNGRLMLGRELVREVPS